MLEEVVNCLERKMLGFKLDGHFTPMYTKNKSMINNSIKQQQN